MNNKKNNKIKKTLSASAFSLGIVSGVVVNGMSFLNSENVNIGEIQNVHYNFDYNTPSAPVYRGFSILRWNTLSHFQIKINKNNGTSFTLKTKELPFIFLDEDYYFELGNSSSLAL